MLELRRGMACHLQEKCPYATNCWGAQSDRKTPFTCDLVVNGQIVEGKYRNPLDQTGKMKVIME